MLDCHRSCLGTLAVIGSLLIAGCSQPTDQQAAAPAPSPAPAVQSADEVPGSGAPEPPAESGLAIKRGIAMAAGDHAMFRACDDPSELWVLDEADGTLTQLLTEDASTLYVEAYGERAPVPDDLAAARGQAGVFIVEQLLYAGSVAEGRGCERPMIDAAVAARGNEPFWAVTVSGTDMVWKQPDAPQEIAFRDLAAQDAEGTVAYRARTPEHKLELLIDALACRDSMSGEFFAFTARAVLDGREFKGCARLGSQDGP